MKNVPIEDWKEYRARQQEREANDPSRGNSIGLKEASSMSGAPKPHDVVRILATAGVNHALIGAHAVGMHTGAPRNTGNIDFIVDDVDKAADALATAFPKLTVERLGETVGKTLVNAQGKEVIDLLNAKNMGRSLAIPESRPVLSDGVEVWVPNPEMLVCLKYIAIRSINHDGAPARSMKKRMYDFGDILALVEASPAFDGQKVYDLLCRAFDIDFAERWKRDLATIRAGRVINLEIDG